MSNISIGESQVMEALWQKGALTTEEIALAVGPANGWADSTVRTLIFRLQKKKAIAGAKADGRFVYRPLIEREDYVHSESQGLLDRLFQGELTPLVSHFANHRRLTPRELEKLKALIAKIESLDD